MMDHSRRKFLSNVLAAGASGCVVNLNAQSINIAPPNVLTLENDHWHLTLDKKTGCIAKLESKTQGWKVQGAGMRLHVPAPEHRFHYLSEQQASEPYIESSRNQVDIIWRGFVSERMGKLEIEVKETIRLDEAALNFSYQIRNGTQAVIESYTYPRLMGLKPPANDKHMRQVAWGYSGMNADSLWPSFGNEVGYYGYDTPAQLRSLGTDTQFTLVLSDTCGLYIGYQDQAQRQVVQICFSLSPAWVDSFNTSAVDPSGKVVDSSIGIDANHLCFIQPGDSQSSEDLVLTSFTGDWHSGADIYKAWRKEWFKAPRSPKWVKEVHSWQQIQINSAEDRLSFPYKDLTRYAQACKRWGVKAIQLTGWQIGGQDRDFPLHDTDPRLGTKEEFKDTIAECKKLGVEIVLFNKYAWADVTAPAYNSEFRKYVTEDPYGDPYTFNGYNYDTPTQIGGINARHGAGMCQASPLWRKRALEEFRKSVELGASGILYDECLWHISPYCFARNHGHPIPGAVFSGDVPLIEGFRSIVDSDEFLFAGESPYDLEFQTYGMSYYRIFSGFVPFARYLDPWAPMSVAVTGWNDRQIINACLLYRFSMSYEPSNFHGELDEMPITLKYGGAVDELRSKYSEWIWDAEFCDTVGAIVMNGTEPLTTYSVYRRSDGRRAVAFANMSDRDHITCEVVFDKPALAELSWVSPEQPEAKPWPGKLELAPASVVVLLEG